MKIAVDCRMLEMSGIGNYLENILHYWSVKIDCSFLLIGDRKKIKKLSLSNKYEVLQCEISIFSVKEFLNFPTKKINQCDAFFCPNYNIASGIKIPIFSVIHDVVFLDVKNLVSPIGKLIRFFFLWRAIRISKKIFSVSEFSKSRIIEHFHCKTDKIIVGYNGINYELLNFQNKNTKPIFDFKYFVFVGNIKKHKGLDILLSAYENIVVQNKPKLVIAGNYENFKTKDKKLIQIFQQQNKNIIFTGKIDNDALFSLIKNSVALIQPSVYEGFGLPPLEALFLETKVILSDIEVFQEIYRDLPVLFFQKNNAEDLKNKLQQIDFEKNINSNYIIEKKYNYEKTANLILSNILSHT
ncbi:MAG: glycosyltransferase family 4 protein [Prevotellaceae bacterium]|jgi:glycosyltransferase involved in cell wall biosynthesis|nr:glycosyltransferase family 4 protein [Prevotellaceae bacterium]